MNKLNQNETKPIPSSIVTHQHKYYEEFGFGFDPRSDAQLFLDLYSFM